MSELYVDVYTIFFRAALTGEELGSRCVDAANPSGWSYASALRSADLNPFQYWIVKGTERLDPNHVLAEKLPLRFKREDFDKQGELHLDLVRADEQTTQPFCSNQLTLHPWPTIRRSSPLIGTMDPNVVQMQFHLRVQWQVRVTDTFGRATWADMMPHENSETEAAYQTNKNILTFAEGSGRWAVDPRRLVQTNTETGTERAIRRSLVEAEG